MTMKIWYWMVLLSCLRVYAEPDGLALDSAMVDEVAREGRVIGVVSTYTKFSISSSTTTMSATCAAFVKVEVCGNGRRRRRSYATNNIESLIKQQNDGLLTSMEDTAPEAISETESHRDGKMLALTFWSTITSTIVPITTSTGTATTLSLSFYCSVNGGTFPSAC